MFSGSVFNQDIRNLGHLKRYIYINLFCGADINQNISNWNVSNVTNMYGVVECRIIFNQNIGDWDSLNVIKHVCNV